MNRLFVLAFVFCAAVVNAQLIQNPTQQPGPVQPVINLAYCCLFPAGQTICPPGFLSTNLGSANADLQACCPCPQNSVSYGASATSIGNCVPCSSTAVTPLNTALGNPFAQSINDLPVCNAALALNGDLCKCAAGSYLAAPYAYTDATATISQGPDQWDQQCAPCPAGTVSSDNNLATSCTAVALGSITTADCGCLNAVASSSGNSATLTFGNTKTCPGATSNQLYLDYPATFDNLEQ